MTVRQMQPIFVVALVRVGVGVLKMSVVGWLVGLEEMTGNQKNLNMEQERVFFRVQSLMGHLFPEINKQILI